MKNQRQGFKDVTIRVTNELKQAIEDRAENLGVSVPELFRHLVFIDIRFPRPLKPDKAYSTKEGSIIKIGFKKTLIPEIEKEKSKHNLTRSRYLRSLAIRELEEYTDFKE